jgi:transposase
MALYVRPLAPDEVRQLEEMQRRYGGQDGGQRARIVLLSANRRGVHDISAMVGLHPINVRKWIHRFNQYGLRGLHPRRSPGRPKLFDENQREAIVRTASTDPRVLGLGFSSWSLQRLRSHLIAAGVLDGISAETIRQELIRSGLIFEGRRWIR